MKDLFASIIVITLMSGSVYSEDALHPAVSGLEIESIIGGAGGYLGSTPIPAVEGWVVYDASKKPIEAFGSDASIRKLGDDLMITGYTLPEGASLQRAGVKEFGMARVGLMKFLRESAVDSTKNTFVTLAETIAIGSAILAEELCPGKLYPATVEQLGLTFDMKLLCKNYEELKK